MWYTTQRLVRFKIYVSVHMLENVNVGEIWGLYTLDYNQVICAQQKLSWAKVAHSLKCLKQSNQLYSIKKQTNNKQTGCSKKWHLQDNSTHHSSISSDTSVKITVWPRCCNNTSEKSTEGAWRCKCLAADTEVPQCTLTLSTKNIVGALKWMTVDEAIWNGSFSSLYMLPTGWLALGFSENLPWNAQIPWALLTASPFYSF